MAAGAFRDDLTALRTIMVDADPYITPATLPAANSAPSPMPGDAAPAHLPEPTFLVPCASEPFGSGALPEVDDSPIAVDAPIDRPVPNLPECGGLGSGRDGDPPATAPEPMGTEDAIHFQTYHSDLLVLRDVAATMLPTPTTTEPGAMDAEHSVPFEVGPDGLRFTFANGPVRCHVRVPYASGTIPSGAGRFQIPAQILRLAALQVVKNKPKPKVASTRLQSLSRSLAPRAVYQGVPDEAVRWAMTPRTSSGKLLYGSTDLNFSAPTDASMPWEEDSSLNEPVRILPDRVCAALRSTKPAAATRIDALPRLSQVAIDAGGACASNLRMYAFHSDTALDGLFLRVAESEISTLTSLMRHLNPTATTIRTSHRTCVVQDDRLTIRFKQPFDTFPVIKPRSSLTPTLAMQCEHSEITRLVTIAMIIAGLDSEARRRLQLQFQIILVGGQLTLKIDTAWRGSRCEGSLGNMTMEPEQASDLRARLSRSLSQAHDPVFDDAGKAAIRDEPAPAIKLGRYGASDLLRSIRPLRSGLLCFEFVEDKAMIVSETMAQHRTDYVLVSGTQDDAHGLPQRRSKRWDAPPRLRI